MTDREIVVLLAEKVMGWKIRESMDKSRVFAHTQDGSVYLFGEISSAVRRWNPLESIADAYEVGMRLPVEDRAFLHRFMKAMDHITCVDKGRLTGGEQFWLEVHATPRQRCMAMVEALEVKE